MLVDKLPWQGVGTLFLDAATGIPVFGRRTGSAVPQLNTLFGNKKATYLHTGDPTTRMYT